MNILFNIKSAVGAVLQSVTTRPSPQVESLPVSKLSIVFMSGIVVGLGLGAYITTNNQPILNNHPVIVSIDTGVVDVVDSVVDIEVVAPTIIEPDLPATHLEVDRTKHFNTKQTSILRLAYKIGAEIGYPETMQAIALQETIAGSYGNRVGDRMLRVGKRSYGVGQIKVITAQYVFSKFPDTKTRFFGNRKLSNITDEEIIVLLITNDVANLTIAAMNFQLMSRNTKNWTEAVVAYNQGLRGLSRIEDPATFIYIKRIRYQILQYVRPFNEETGLGQDSA